MSIYKKDNSLKYPSIDGGYKFGSSFVQRNLYILGHRFYSRTPK